jgi:hypothetical protein
LAYNWPPVEAGFGSRVDIRRRRRRRCRRRKGKLDISSTVLTYSQVDKNTLKQLKGAPPLKVVGTVVPAEPTADDTAETADNGSANGDEQLRSPVKKTAVAAPLTIWVDAKRPCAYSCEAETVLFRPPGNLEHLTLGDESAPKKNGAIDAKKDEDLGPVLELVSSWSWVSKLTASAQSRRPRAGPPLSPRRSQGQEEDVLWLGT